ncbi:MAG: hypothetical protein IT374_24505 [Polyangiaceae bacterium]|nr:hypothetical protein [Polyangiaceae bacterium]
MEFKDEHVEQIRAKGWHAWERKRRSAGEPIEVLVGGTSSSFLRLVRFERDALGEGQGHRLLLAERIDGLEPFGLAAPSTLVVPVAPRLQSMARELELSESEVLDVIASARRLKMAVRGWVAEEHLVRSLRQIDGVTECERPDEEGGVDVRLRFEGSRPITIECKNVLRETTTGGVPRIDFQRARASKGDKCSRYYAVDSFDAVAACLHAVTEKWEFRFAETTALDRLGPDHDCCGRLSNRVRVDDRWQAGAASVLRRLAQRAR